MIFDTNEPYDGRHDILYVCRVYYYSTFDENKIHTLYLRHK